MVPLADVPKGTNIMRCHYVFAVKRLKNGEVEKFKARLVADGNTQTSRDYDRIFSTVVKSQTIRAILIYSCSMDFNLSTIDVRQAYIQSDTGDHTLYMMPPPGVSSRDSQGRLGGKECPPQVDRRERFSHVWLEQAERLELLLPLPPHQRAMLFLARSVAQELARYPHEHAHDRRVPEQVRPESSALHFAQVARRDGLDFLRDENARVGRARQVVCVCVASRGVMWSM